MAQRWFIDTSFVIAVVSLRDNFHEVATDLSTRIEAESIKLVTSDAVLLEIGGALSKVAYRAAAIEIINALRRDPQIEIISIGGELMQRAFALFASRTDKEWSLTDCVSFEIMREAQVINALTADAHFEQAGFTALMRRH